MEQYSTPLTPEMQSHNKSSVTAMVLGIVSLVVTWFPVVGLVLAIVGLTMSRSNRKFAEAHGFKENSMNTAGYVTSIVGLIAGVITLVYSSHEEHLNNAVAMREFLLNPHSLDAPQ